MLRYRRYALAKNIPKGPRRPSGYCSVGSVLRSSMTQPIGLPAIGDCIAELGTRERSGRAIDVAKELARHRVLGALLGYERRR